LAEHNDDRTWVAYAPLWTVHQNAQDPTHIDWYVWRLVCKDAHPDEFPRPPPPKSSGPRPLPTKITRPQTTFVDWLAKPSGY
jgi:hypothetical protein